MIGAQTTAKSGLPLAIAFCCEAWRGVNPRVRPADDPERIECVSITVLTVDGRARAVFYDLRRKTDDTLVMVKRCEASNQSNDTTLVCNLLRYVFDGARDLVTNQAPPDELKAAIAAVRLGTIAINHGGSEEDDDG